MLIQLYMDTCIKILFLKFVCEEKKRQKLAVDGSINLYLYCEELILHPPPPPKKKEERM